MLNNFFVKNLNKIIGISYLIVLISIVSCQQPKDLGLNLTDDLDALNVIFTDTFTLEAEVIMLDSVVTNNPELITIGTYQDPDFGKITAQSFIQWQTISEERLIADNPIYDSIVVRLDGAVIYGDTLKSMTLKVHQLQQVITDTLFFNSSTLPFESTELGRKTITPTVITEEGVIEIKLDNTFGNTIYELYRQGAASNTIIETIKGTVIMPEATDDAAILGFATLSPNTRLRIYYHNGSDPTPIAIDFVPTTTKTFNNVTADFTGTKLVGLSKTNPIPISNTNQKGYIHSSLGIATKTSVPHLKALTETQQSIISKAELVIFPEQETESFLIFPQRITLLELNDDNTVLKDIEGLQQRVQVDGKNPQANISPITFTYNSRTQDYRAAMTLHLQSILVGNKGESFAIYELLTNTANIAGFTFNAMSFNRAVIEFDKNSTRKTKLELFYTLVE